MRYDPEGFLTSWIEDSAPSHIHLQAKIPNTLLYALWLLLIAESHAKMYTSNSKPGICTLPELSKSCLTTHRPLGSQKETYTQDFTGSCCLALGEEWHH